MAKHPTKAEVTANTAKDLRTAYLLTFDNFTSDPTEVAAMIGGSANTRYGRELLGVLTKADLLAEVEDGEGNAAWQVIDPGTYDDHERDEAEKVIDAWLTTNLPQAEAQQVVKAAAKPKARSNGGPVSVDGAPCLCGCGEATGKKSNYRPGHDARHAGEVGRALAAMPEPSAEDLAKMLAVLPSDLLRAKAQGVAAKAREKATSKAKPKAEPVEGTATVGKKEVAAIRHPDGSVTDLEGKPLSKTAAKTFEPA